MSKHSDSVNIRRWQNVLEEGGLSRIARFSGTYLRWHSDNGEWTATASSLGNGPRVEVFRLTSHGLGNKWNSQLVHPDASPQAYAKLVETIFLQEVLREDD
jgi:hypothetical protein